MTTTGKLFKADGDKRPKVKKGLDELLQLAWDQGWGMRRGGNNHVICYPPGGGRMVPVPATPSGSRTVDNKRAQFRRAGLRD